MMQTHQSAYHLKYKNCRRIPSASSSSGTSTISSKCTTISDNASDIIDADYVDKHIPKMELLKINYVNKMGTAENIVQQQPSRKSIATIEEKELVQLRAKKRLHTKPTPRSHSDGELKIHELAKLSSTNYGQPKQSGQQPKPPHYQHPLKYAVYKKHNPQDFSKDVKLQYTNDDAFFKSKKKYLAFESKKRSSLDNIQFYFDSKSYERHVDNKMYGILGGKTTTGYSSHDHHSDSTHGKSSASGSGDYKSSSWNFVKATKSFLNGANAIRMSTENRNTKKVPSSKKMLRESSLVDVSRVGEIFKETTRRASADDILDSSERSSAARISIGEKEPNRSGSVEKMKRLINSFEEQCGCEHKVRNDKLVHATEKRSNAALPIYAVPVVNSSKAKEARQNAHGMLDSKGKSMVNIGHGKRLFGNFQTNFNAKSNCGYKNCTFINCPMSSPVCSSSVGDDELGRKSAKIPTNEEINSKVKAIQNISITKIDVANNKSKLYLKVKDFDESEHFSAIALNNLKNLKNTTTNLNGNTLVDVGSGANESAGSTTIPIKFSPSNQNLNNSMKCKSVEKLDFNSTSTIENRKLNNLVTADKNATANDANRVKIFICNAPSVSSEASSVDSTSDYYDSVPNEDVVISKDDTSTIEDTCLELDGDATKATKPLGNMFPSRLGCDGAIFWNDCYYYDEHTCCECGAEDAVEDINGPNNKRNCDCNTFVDDFEEINNKQV